MDDRTALALNFQGRCQPKFKTGISVAKQKFVLKDSCELSLVQPVQLRFLSKNYPQLPQVESVSQWPNSKTWNCLQDLGRF